MRSRLAITTLQDVTWMLGYFGPDIELGEDDSLVVEAPPVTVRIKPVFVVFQWKVEALDDQSDKDEGFSSDPTRDIIEFLQGDIPGSQFLDKYASRLMRRIASRVAFRERRGSAIIDLHHKKIDELAGQMAKKGWRTDKFVDDNGLPVIRFEIGERYSGTIMLHDVVYEYEFSIEGRPDLTETGTANDVEERLMAWMHSPSVAPLIESEMDTLKA